MQLRDLIRSPLRALAWRCPRMIKHCVRLFRPRGDDYSSLLQRQIGLHSVGKGCHINFSVVFTDPQWVGIGSNVVMSDCSVLGHDTSSHMLSKAYGLPLDEMNRMADRSAVEGIDRV